MPVFGLAIDKTWKNLIWLFLGICLSLSAHALMTFTFVNPYFPVVSKIGKKSITQTKALFCVILFLIHGFIFESQVNKYS